MNRLPPEVISLCATFVSSTDPRPIIPLTHVCRYWRKAITSNPRNWASIDNRWKQLVPTCLRRAGAVPLTVNINVSAIECDEPFVGAILPHASRIAHLSLTGYPSVEAMSNVIPTFFTSTMGDLISLELQQSSESIEPFLPSISPAFPISWNLSKLTSLHLTRTPLYPAITSVTSLVDLKLDGYRMTLSPFSEFMAFLGANTNLQFIVLDIEFDEFELPLSCRVSLPHLRRLSLTCADPFDARALISSISLPHGVSLEVACSSTNRCTTLSSFLPSPPTPIQKILTPIVTIKCQHNPSMVQFYGNDSSFSFQRASGNFNPYPELSLFEVTAVRELHLKNFGFSGRPSPLSRLPALETLVLVNVTTSLTSFTFLTAEPVLCPSLKTIAFFNCRLDPGVIEELEKAVVNRKNSTAAWLYRIIIVSQTGHLPDHDLVLRLRRSVPCVNVRMEDELPELL